MAKFLVLYMAPAAAIEQMMKTMTPEQGKEDMEKWRMWMKERASHFADMGTPVGKTKRVTPEGAVDAKNEVTGYSIVEAGSHEAAAEIFRDVPNIPGGYVDVMPLMSMDGSK